MNTTENDKINIKKLKIAESLTEHYSSVGDVGAKILELVDEIEDLARYDTANQIFAELEKVAWQRIEPSRLAEFYKQFCKAKDSDAALKVAIAFSIIGFDAGKYEAIRKRYRVD